MSWALGGLGVIVVLLVVAGASAIICKRYSLRWQCGLHDLWIICEEWRRKLAWLWAPREEKVGLVKAQHPNAQALPGLYRQSSTNSSQYILHTDSDLRLDAQGAFTRFEAVDRDLHLSTTEQHQHQQSFGQIPPQPLRPAPQPRAASRPRPSPLRAATNVDYLRLRECEPAPLTPPPLPAFSRFHRGSLFFQVDSPSPPPLPPAPNTLAMALMFHGQPMRLDSENSLDETKKIRYSVQGAALSEQMFDSEDVHLSNDTSQPYGSYNIVRDTNNSYASIYGVQDSYIHRVSSKCNLQDLERITRYIQSLPDSPGNVHYYGVTDEEEEEAPPPAPPDPKQQQQQQQQKGDSPEPTTGEKIFKALRAVTSHSYIDASEFYNSILSSAQHVQNLACSSTSEINSSHSNKQDHPNFSSHVQTDQSRQATDLYSLELNQEAHRTAQQVFNSLQDPPVSPMLFTNLDQQTYSYLSDPCFTRTSEDIFNSLEHRRRDSEERLNGIQDLLKLEVCESARRNCNQGLLSATKEAQMKRRLSQILNGCQSVVVEEGLQLARRSSLGLESEPQFNGCYNNYEELTCLQRAISCESLCSDTSVVLNDLEPSPDNASIVGMICIGLEHDSWPSHIGDSKLIVSVLEARDLIAPDSRPAQHTFARVCLLPDSQTYIQTRLYKNTDSPSYQEKFYFPLDGGPIGRTILVEVFSYEISEEGRMDIDSSLLGEASLRLDPPLGPPATTWLPLLSSVLSMPRLGELMFSLSYLPTAERLTLVLVKARNLRGTAEVPGDFFVKVYMLQQGKKMHKKRTSIKKGDKSPIFNEAIIFNVPAHTLHNTQLRLTVAEMNGDLTSETKPYSLGHVIVGATTTGHALTHWRQMLTALRRPIAMWHPLRK
ncbi:PREDICTED: uncharacterized protein LOC105366444 [Ceratosolen solmsi marchali]|uniref:Uncharacterized protein LOC105366444 n=1 Tax=Ceratosolen solmsi marchali TaxID=326594 RepID=A0AAJ6YRZ4_9HYME|nr:PREDICTED: uncharacterized protein LOC105366444 [Ceratosolen solmsi marchali]